MISISEDYPLYVTRAAMESLADKLNLTIDEFSQDWEYESANSARLNEFIRFYLKGSLNEEEKFALMIIILSSFNDALDDGLASVLTWEEIKAILINDGNIHHNTIDYWALDYTEDLEDCFSITPYIREFRDHHRVKKQ